MENFASIVTTGSIASLVVGAGGSAAFNVYHSITHSSYNDSAKLTNNIISENPDDYLVLDGIPGYVSFEFTTPQIITKYNLIIFFLDMQ